MGQDAGTGGAPVTESREPEEIRSEIEQTREELGDTVEALAKKADVKEQAKKKIEDAKASAQHKKEQLLGKAREASPDGAAGLASQGSQKVRENPLPAAAAGAFAVGFLAGRLTKR